MNTKNKIKELEAALDTARAEFSKERQAVLADSSIYKELEAAFYATKYRMYLWSECGGIDEAIRYNALSKIDEKDREHFAELVCADYGFTIDWDNDVVMQCLGDDNITINDDGDVFEGSKLIISHRNYTDDADRNAQIEAHMEKSGYFPGVFYSDRHGNLTIINTKA